MTDDTISTDSKANAGPVSRFLASRFWREWRGFIIFVIVMLIFRSIIADWNQVPSGSMKPTILEGDRVMVDKMAFDLRVPFTRKRIAWFGDPERGDVVTFVSPEDERLFIKRTIGLPGDVVELASNVLIINGERASYTPLSDDAVAALDIDSKHRYRFVTESILGDERTVMLRRTRSSYSTFGPVTVPEGMYLMLGDNRDNSGDYRRIGLVSRDRILGHAHGIAFSWDYMKLEAPRLDRFFEDLP